MIDPLHRAHILQMMNAKAVAGRNGISIAGVLARDAVLEKKKAPILSLDERIFIASSIQYNDLVVVQDTYSPLSNLCALQPDILMESTSHNVKDINEVKQYMKSIGGRVIVTPYYKYQSSTDIKNIIRGNKK